MCDLPNSIITDTFKKGVEKKNLFFFQNAHLAEGLRMESALCLKKKYIHKEAYMSIPELTCMCTAEVQTFQRFVSKTFKFF